MEAPESLEDIQTRHRKEQKDLQARITQKKKAATKKTRKGVNSECEELERQLKERQEQERATLNGDAAGVEDVPELVEDSDREVTSNELNGISESLNQTSVAEKEEEEGGDNQPQKRNRQKERLARRAAEQAAAIDEAKAEAANQPDQKAVERKKMLEQFTAKGLVEKSIRPDGHCLFSAVADQLAHIGVPLGENGDQEKYKVVRRAAARYIEGHPDDFVAWLDEPLDTYIEKIGETAEWGGHLELMALAKNYNVEICVVQDGAEQKIEPGTEGEGELQRIWLAYYRHGFGLGEHYNSLRKAPS